MKEEGMKDIVNKRIRYYMHDQNLSILDLAQILEYSHQRTSRLVNAQNIKHQYSLDSIEKLALAFKVTVIDMITPLPADINPALLKIPSAKQKKI